MGLGSAILPIGKVPAPFNGPLRSGLKSVLKLPPVALIVIADGLLTSTEIPAPAVSVLANMSLPLSLDVIILLEPNVSGTLSKS